MGVDMGRRTESWGLHSATDFLGGLQYILCSHYSNGKLHLCPELFARGRAHDTGDRKYGRFLNQHWQQGSLLGGRQGFLSKLPYPEFQGFEAFCFCKWKSFLGKYTCSSLSLWTGWAMQSFPCFVEQAFFLLSTPPPSFLNITSLHPPLSS